MTATTMQAVRFHGPGGGIRVEEVPYPSAGPGEVVMKVAACGLCGSDVHFLEGMPAPGPVPIVLGHEPSGTIESVGEGVHGWSVGDRVAVTLGNGCGVCPTCRSGAVNACPFMKVPGLHIDGAYSEAMAVPADSLVRIPDGVSFEAAALATDCVASPYHALKCRATLMKGERVVVVGVGGLGTQAVALAKILGAARIVAVDRSPAALDRAVRAGADVGVAVVDGRDPVPEITDAAGGGVEVAIECVGAPETVTIGLRSLAPGGRLAVVGVGMMPPPIELPQALFALWELSVIGSFGSHRDDLEEVLALEADDLLDIASAVSHRVDVAGVPEGLEQLRVHRDDPQRILMVPG